MEKFWRDLVKETVAECVRERRALADALDPEQAAAWLGISKSHLTNLRVRGDGPKFCRAGRLVRYRVRDLEDWLGPSRDPEPQGPYRAKAKSEPADVAS